MTEFDLETVQRLSENLRIKLKYARLHHLTQSLEYERQLGEFNVDNFERTVQTLSPYFVDESTTFAEAFAAYKLEHSATQRPPIFSDAFRAWLNQAATFTSRERMWADALMRYFAWPDGDTCDVDRALECYRGEYPA